MLACCSCHVIFCFCFGIHISRFLEVQIPEFPAIDFPASVEAAAQHSGSEVDEDHVERLGLGQSFVVTSVTDRRGSNMADAVAMDNVGDCSWLAAPHEGGSASLTARLLVVRVLRAAIAPTNVEAAEIIAAARLLQLSLPQPLASLAAASPEAPA